MNDFLSNLAAKSLNLTEMVQPRLTMLFEPSQSSIWPTPAADNGVETIDGEYSTVQGEIGTSSILKPVARHPADSSFLEVKPEMSQINIDRQNSSLSFKSAGKNPVISPGETGQESDRLVLPETLKPMVNIGDFQSVKNQRWYSPASEEAETKPEAQSAKRTKNQQGDQKEEPSG